MTTDGVAVLNGGNADGAAHANQQIGDFQLCIQGTKKTRTKMQY